MEDKATAGSRMAAILDELLSGIAKERVDTKEVEQLNACFAPCNPEPEFSGPVEDSKTFNELKTLRDTLLKDPQTRSIVVDNNSDSQFTEDSIWLSLPKWEARLDLPSLYWHVVTVRSIENRVFRESFPGEAEWKVTHQSGPFGTTFISKEGEPGNRIHTKIRRSHNAVSEKVKRKRHCGALFSDQPRMVALYGRKVGQQLWDVAEKIESQPKFVIRVFRCAPRWSLTEHIARVLNEERTDNVFDIWIRHHDMPDKVLGGFGRYVHAANSSMAGVLEKLTDIVQPDEKLCLDATTSSSVISWNASVESSLLSFSTAKCEDASRFSINSSLLSFATARCEEASRSGSSWDTRSRQYHSADEFESSSSGDESSSEGDWEDLLPETHDEKPPSGWREIPVAATTAIGPDNSSPQTEDDTIEESRRALVELSQEGQDTASLPWEKVLRRVC